MLTTKSNEESLWRFRLLSDESYLVGFLAGDGAFNQHLSHYRIVLDTPYPSLAERFANEVLAVTGKHPLVYMPKSKHEVRVQLQSREWYEHLLALRNRARTGELPVTNRQLFVKGFFDAEGCLQNPGTRNEQVTFSNNNVALLDLVKVSLQLLGIETGKIYAHGERCHGLAVRAHSLQLFKTVIGVDKPHRGITPSLSGGPVR